MIASEAVPKIEADSAWKDALEDFFPDIIEFSFFDLYKIINWKQAWIFLDKELNEIAVQSESGIKFVDKLVKVFLLNGDEQWLLIHIEVQGNHDSTFTKRMYIYNYRIFDKYQKHPVSCALLTDSSYDWRPNFYEHNQAGCEIFFKFHMIKLIDLESKRDLLENSNNPFTFIILIQLDSLKTKMNTKKQKYQLKWNYTKWLYQKGFNREQIKKIYYFLDRLVKLPKNLEIEYRNAIVNLEEENQMTYVSTIEQMALEEGMERGLQQGLTYVSSIERLALEEGMERGLQQGLTYVSSIERLALEEGMERGLQQGLTYVSSIERLALEEGSTQRAHEIALSLLAKKQSIDFVSDVTGLSKEDLLILQSKI